MEPRDVAEFIPVLEARPQIGGKDLLARSDLPHDLAHHRRVIRALVISGKYATEVLPTIGFAVSKRRRHTVDRVADAVERMLSVRPAKEIVSFHGAAATCFDQREAGKQTPVQTMRIGLGDKNLGELLIGTMLVIQKLAEDSLPKIELLAILRQILLA